MTMRFPEFELFGPKVDAAWTALQRQYAGRISDAELDHLFACFAYGLTSPIYGEEDPTLHFDLCRALVAMKLPPDRTEAALHTVPEATQPWVESARGVIEGKGAKMGSMLRQVAPNVGQITGVDANSTERLGNSEGNEK